MCITLHSLNSILLQRLPTSSLQIQLQICSIILPTFTNVFSKLQRRNHRPHTCLSNINEFRLHYSLLIYKNFVGCSNRLIFRHFLLILQNDAIFQSIQTLTKLLQLSILHCYYLLIKGFIDLWLLAISCFVRNHWNCIILSSLVFTTHLHGLAHSLTQKLRHRQRHSMIKHIWCIKNTFPLTIVK